MNSVAFNEKVKNFVDENQRNIVDDIKTLVSFKSILGAPQPGAPFGEENRKVLDCALNMAKNMGLTAVDCQGYLGYAELKGAKEDYIASIAHLDVVPEGNGWKADPFIAREVDGWIIGRGVCDNKGPAVLTLYLLKFFKEHYPQLPYTLRALFGCEEETGMRDLDYYLENYPAPVFAFTPDANFPVCCGEKGIASFDLISEKIENGNVLSFTAGIASNVVPDRACLTLRRPTQELPQQKGITIGTEQDVVTLNAQGIGGHAAMPEGTENAIGMLVNYCLDNHLLTEKEEQFFQLLHRLHASNDGKGLGIDSADSIFTPLTCIGGMIQLENGQFIQNINVRYPTSITGEEIKSILKEKLAQVHGTLGNGMAKEPFYVDKNSAPIQALLQTYNEITGKNEDAYTIGGGTYARKFPSAAAFGIEPAESEKDFFPDFIGSVHGAEEGYSIDGFMKALEILIIATAKLMEIDF